MKHNIVFKFIAVFLCAASLMGALGGGFGILMMTEWGLYQRSWDEAYQEHLAGYSESLAGEIAVRYAAMNLGGLTSEMADQYYGTYWHYGYFDWGRFGYTLKDAEGNVLQEQALDEGLSVAYSQEFPVEGQYVKVLSTMTEEEYEALNAPEETEPADNGPLSGFNRVPENGAEVYHIHVTFSDGELQVLGNGEVLGRLYYVAENQLAFESYSYIGHLDFSFNDGFQREAVSITCLDENLEPLCQLENEFSVFSEYSYRDNILGFTLMPIKNEQAGEAVLYDAIPPEGMHVSRVHVTYADGFEESAGGEPDIGFLGYDEDGYVEFTTDAGVLAYREDPVTYIAFFDGDTLVYEASDLVSVGSITMDYDNMLLTFRAREGVEDVTVIHTDDLYVYDDIPPQGYSVGSMDVWLKDGSQAITIQRKLGVLGDVSHDSEGNVVFYADSWKDFSFSKPAEVVYILMTGGDGRLLYESYAAGYPIGEGGTIGIFAYDENDQLVFSTAPDAALSLAKAVEETPAESTVPTETVPETTSPEETAPTVTEAEVSAETTETELSAEATIQEATMAEDSVAAVTTPLEPMEEPTAPTTGETMPDTTVPTEPVPAAMGEAGKEYYNFYDSETGQQILAEYIFEEMPEYTVELRLAEGALSYGYTWTLLQVVYDLRDYLFPTLGICLLLFAVLAVYLCCAAGKKPGSEEIRAGGLNCIPLDLYLGGAFLGEMVLFWLGVEGVPYLLDNEFRVGLGFAVLLAFAMCLLFVAFCFACAAQFKTSGGYWWRNSLCARCLVGLGVVWNWLVKVFVWLGEVYETKLLPMIVRLCKGAWKVIVVCWHLLVKAAVWLGNALEKGMTRMGEALTRFFSLLPLTWQWLLVGFVLVFWLFLAVLSRAEFWLLVWAFVALATVLYGAHCFGSLLEAAKRMSKGDLDEKVDDKLLTGGFQDFANELNGLADVAVVAAQKQLKSERMKTELITNVSHDIKTPLTSIINYVDLMQKPHTEEEQEMYLEVLDRQSQRLKKLIDDLMEMSKASTGNLAVDIQQVDAGETVNQALGEFADKLEKAQLTPVFRQPDTPIQMMADGRLVWRVMSNLLGNAVKYALPGTRVYLDLAEVDGKVILSMKNISREELNVSADELLERFVRGDASRNTEGSGLGLNIAQSLMQLQKGQLQILVDGDLFKVTLIFPGVEK